MSKTIDTLINSGKKILAGAALITSLAGITGCHTHAKRDYAQYPQHRGEIAFYNIEQILGEICSYTSVFRKTFNINEEGFHCESGTNIIDYSWDNIEEVKCKGGAVEIKGKYETNVINTLGPIWQDHTQQCDDLAEAFQIYLKERRKEGGK